MTKILLVEDDKSLREIYGVRLLAEGYDIISAGDGEAALAMAIKERPSLIVSDVMMPKISGFDMLDILRSTTETKNIKVIMMTALSSEDQRARGEALGADRYLVKSQVGIEDVVRTVHDVLGDAPVSAASAAQTFGSSAPRPAPSAPVPSRSAQPLQQTMPTPPPFTAAATPQPRASQPQMTTAPTAPSSALPQPTAPFSTTRPANLGERVLHPVSPAAGGQKLDIGSLMAQELGQADSSAPSAPPVPPPPAPPAPTVSYQPPAAPAAPAAATTPAMPQPAPAPASAAPSPMPAPGPVAPAPHEEEEHSGISFEETPRSAPPTSGPQPPFTPGPQPPAA
jgi:CheY-like chemotaxis protein